MAAPRKQPFAAAPGMTEKGPILPFAALGTSDRLVRKAVLAG